MLHTNYREKKRELKLISDMFISVDK